MRGSRRTCCGSGLFRLRRSALPLGLSLTGPVHPFGVFASRRVPIGARQSTSPTEVELPTGLFDGINHVGSDLRTGHSCRVDTSFDPGVGNRKLLVVLGTDVLVLCEREHKDQHESPQSSCHARMPSTTKSITFCARGSQSPILDSSASSAVLRSAFRGFLPRGCAGTSK